MKKDTAINKFFIDVKHERRMGTYDPKDEDFHPEHKSINPSFELNETQFFGFSVPEERIHALTYVWAHPNLDLVSSGVFVVQGLKHFAPAFEICDYRAYLPMSDLNNSLLSFQTSGNYGVEVIEPGKHFRTTYLDKDRKNSFDVHHKAMYEPCVWSNGTHLEQVMHTDGEVLIRGKSYNVNGTHVRDRSWGEVRTEAPKSVPPITWITGVFDSGFSFHLTAMDDPGRNPVWKEHFHIKPEDTLKFGWVIVDGETIPVEKVSKLISYDDSMFPKRVELDITDRLNRNYQIVGEVVAGFPFHAWPNCRWPICLTKWAYNGQTGWGDTQDGQWTDFLLKILK